MCLYVLYDTQYDLYVRRVSRNPKYDPDEFLKSPVSFTKSIYQAKLWESKRVAERRCQALNDDIWKSVCVVPVRIVRED